MHIYFVVTFLVVGLKKDKRVVMFSIETNSDL